MLQRLLIALPQVKEDNASKNLLNEISENHVFLISSKRDY